MGTETNVTSPCYFMPWHSYASKVALRICKGAGIGSEQWQRELAMGLTQETEGQCFNTSHDLVDRILK